MRDLALQEGVQNDTDFEFGKIEDGKTVVSEAAMADVLYTMQKIASVYGTTINGLPDNNANEYQLFEAIFGYSKVFNMQLKPFLTSPDFQLSDFTLDNTWRTLPLTGKIPLLGIYLPQAIQVKVYSVTASSSPGDGGFIEFRAANDTTNVAGPFTHLNKSQAALPVENATEGLSGINPDAEMQYRGGITGSGFTQLDVTIKGYGR